MQQCTLCKDKPGNKDTDLNISPPVLIVDDRKTWREETPTDWVWQITLLHPFNVYQDIVC